MLQKEFTHNRDTYNSEWAVRENTNPYPIHKTQIFEKVQYDMRDIKITSDPSPSGTQQEPKVLSRDFYYDRMYE